MRGRLPRATSWLVQTLLLLLLLLLSRGLEVLLLLEASSALGVPTVVLPRPGAPPGLTLADD
jgi:hypothetical protein